MIRITDVRPLEPHRLRLWFSDGSIHEVDLGPTLARGGVFADVYADPTLFAQVRVEPGFGTIEWPGSLDLDPDVLHGDRAPIDGEPYRRRIVRGPRRAQPTR